MATKVKLIDNTISPTLAGASFTSHIDLGDNNKIRLGDSDDLQIYHDGTHNYIDDAGTGNLYIRASQSIALQKADGTEDYLTANNNGAVTLYYNNSAKIATSSTGATVTGNLAVTGDLDITGNVNSASVTDLDVTDKTITLGAGQTEALSGGSGIIIDGSSASLLWNETNSQFDFNKTINITSGNMKIDGNQVGLQHVAQGIASGNSVANNFQIGRWKGTTFDRWMLVPVNNGSEQYSDEFGYNFNTGVWFFDDKLSIGAVDASSKLHISGANTTGGIFVEDSSDSNASPVIKVQGKRSDANKSQSFSGGISLESLYTGGLAPDTKHAGTIYFGINHTDGTASNIAYSASISGILEGDANSASDMPTGLVFYTGDAGTALGTANTTYGTERMRIDHDGNVGIGGAPDSSGRLLVKNGGTNQIVLTNNDSATTNLNMGNFAGAAYISQNYYYDSGHQADDNTKGAYEVYIGDDAYGINYHSAGAMGTRRRDFAITSAGNVGMGTNAPSFASGSGLEIERAGIATLRLQNTSGKSVEITQDSDFKIECMNSSSDIHLIPTANVGVGTENPNSTLHVYGTGQLDLMKIERASSTPGITFVNGADTAGTFGFQLMDNDEYWAGAYDGSNYNYWFKGNSSVFRAEKPVASSTDSGTRQYSHLCTGSFYQGTGAIVIETNIPAHNESGNANMFSIKIRGYEYAVHGSIDLNVGCYAGENQYYSANYNSNYIADGWRGNIKFAKNDTTGKVAIILGQTSTTQRCELAVVDFIQGFQNVNESYASGWSMSLKTSLSNYSQQTDMVPRHQSPRPGFHAYLTSNTNLTSGVQQPLLTSTTFNEGGHYNTSNGRFTAPTEGVYQFNFSITLTSSSVNQRYLSAEALVNGSTKYLGGWFNKTTGGNNNSSTYGAATGSALIKLSRNDYVQFQCELHAADAALGGIPGYTYISGILVG